MLRALGLLTTVLLTFTTARVQRSFSDVYDRFDIEGQTQVPLRICNQGCYLYASISSNNTADDIKHLSVAQIQADGTVSNLFRVAVLATTFLMNGYKQPSHLETAGNYVISNSAPNKAGVPIVIYAVSQRFYVRQNPPYFVYEARLFNKTDGHHQYDRITIMSADPFTLQNVYADGQVNLYAGGYDVTITGTPDICFPLYTGNDTINLAPVPFPSPLMTLSFPNNLNYNIVLTMTASRAIVLSNGQHTALITPGYGGCGNPQSYRYDAHPQKTIYVVQSTHVDLLSHFSLYNDIITNGSVRVTTESPDGTTVFYGNSTSRYSKATIIARFILPALMQADDLSSFGIRVTLGSSGPIPAPNNITATSAKVPETTTKSAGYYFGFCNVLLVAAHLLHSVLS